MALTRADLLTQIEASSDATEINTLNQKYAAVEREMGVLLRAIESVSRTISLINNMDTPPAVLTNCRTALESELTRFQNELVAY